MTNEIKKDDDDYTVDEMRKIFEDAHSLVTGPEADYVAAYGYPVHFATAEINRMGGKGANLSLLHCMSEIAERTDDLAKLYKPYWDKAIDAQAACQQFRDTFNQFCLSESPTHRKLIARLTIC